MNQNGQVTEEQYEKQEQRIAELEDLKRDVEWWAKKHDIPLEAILNEAADPPTIDSFWEIDAKKDRIRIDRSALKQFLQSRGFGKIYVDDGPESQFVRIQNGKVRRTSAEKIGDFIMRHVEQAEDYQIPNGYDAEDVESALLRGANIYFGDSLLRRLQPVDPPFKRDTAERAFFYFANGFVEVTADGATMRSYDALDGVIWEDEVIPHEFEPSRERDESFAGDWGQFLQNVSGQDPDRFQALATSIGYLLHGHKSPAQAKAVVFMDENIANVPSGRSGKSLVGEAIGKMVPSVRVDAKNFRFDRRFAFQDVQLDTAVMEFNDAPKSFQFERLFSVITDDMQVEKKGRDSVTIPFEESPKFLLSTNYVVEGEGASFEDRVFQVEFHPHYNQNRTPIDEFGREFFTQWDSAEWSRFYTGMIECVRRYLDTGLHNYRHVNLNVRKLRQETTLDFAEWILEHDFEAGREFDKAGLYNTFRDEYAGDYESLRKRTFTLWLYTYARLFRGGGEGEGYTERKSGSTRYITFLDE